MRLTRTQSDAIEQLQWSVRALPVRARSRLAPGRTARRVRDVDRLHLGCGSHLLDGWANLDVGGPAGVIRYDLACPLPVPDASVSFVYTEHFIEHVTAEQGRALLAECARVLRPGGVLRVSTPDLATLVEAYLAGRITEWADMEWLPESSCDLLNEGMRLWGHRYLWDEVRLASVLLDEGFSSVERAAWRQSTHPSLRGLESRPDHRDLIVEATR